MSIGLDLKEIFLTHRMKWDTGRHHREVKKISSCGLAAV